MELTFLCPNCGVVNHVPSLAAAGRGTCSQCRTERSLHCELVEGGQLLACPWCATTDLYIQKDFPQGLGLFIVIVGFVISTVFWYLEMPLFTYLVLLASALLDMVLYYRVPDVTICYRCLSQVRGAGSNPEAGFIPSTWPSASGIARSGSGSKSCASGAARSSRHRRPCPARR